MVHKGKLAAATGLLGIAVLANAYHFMPKPEHLSADTYNLRAVKQLELNLDDRVTTHASMTREEGLLQITPILKENALEEAWIYLPALEHWYEVGRRSTVHADAPTIFHSENYSDAQALDKLMQTNKTIWVIHDHPSKNIMNETVRERVRKKEKPAAARIQYNRNLTFNVLPSKGDIETLLEVSRVHRNVYWNTIWFNKPKTKFCVKSEYGAFDFWLTRLGAESYTTGEETWESLKKNRAENLMSKLHTHMDKYDPVLGYDCAELEAHIDSWNNHYLHINFTPEEKIGLEKTMWERFASSFDFLN
ncbi:hypothetical protein GOV10_02260 [Candidatus Woesearchaeota archaeon]|nr:hypothetical protein [Candidatus Woesearchaeota archaeon]